MTRKPCIRNDKELKMNAVSAETSRGCGLAMPAVTTATARAIDEYPKNLCEPPSERVGVGLAGPDPDSLRDIEHKDLAVADPAGRSRLLDLFDN